MRLNRRRRRRRTWFVDVTETQPLPLLLCQLHSDGQTIPRCVSKVTLLHLCKLSLMSSNFVSNILGINIHQES